MSAYGNPEKCNIYDSIIEYAEVNSDKTLVKNVNQIMDVVSFALYVMCSKEE